MRRCLPRQRGCKRSFPQGNVTALFSSVISGVPFRETRTHDNWVAAFAGHDSERGKRQPPVYFGLRFSRKASIASRASLVARRARPRPTVS